MTEKYLELYKKYRPKVWKNLIGQQAQVRSIQRAILSDKIPTAYMFSGERGVGKALHKDTLIPTPNGCTTMDKLKVEDFALGSDGNKVKVLDKYCPNDPESFLLTFSNGSTIKTSGGHLWEVEKEGNTIVLSTKELFEKKLNKDFENSYSIKVIPNPILFEINETPLTINPYALGIWLGAGDSVSTVFTSMEQAGKRIAENINKTFENEVVFFQRGDKTPFLHYYKINSSNGEQTTYDFLKEMDLLGNKHIPNQYLYGSVETRKELLRGLLDTAGSINDEGRINFSDKNDTLFSQFITLVNSLGYQSIVSEPSGKNEQEENKNLRVASFYTTDKVFGSDRRNKKIQNTIPEEMLERIIINIEEIEDNPEDYYCISVDAEDELFLCDNSFIKTHNTSAALLTAKAINCLNPNPKNADPCNECEVCVSINNGNQMGVTYISSAQIKGVEEIRDLVQKARLEVPIKQQVFIIDEIHNLRTGKGFEALLIPLEEENMPSLFIFCTTETQKVPDTILSRVQSRKFNLVNPELMTKYIGAISNKEELGLDEEALSSVVRAGRGSVRDTLSKLEEFASSGETAPTFGGELLEAMSSRKTAEAWGIIAKAEASGIDCRDLGEQLFEDLRDLALLSSNNAENLVSKPPVNDLKAVVVGLSGIPGILAAADEIGEGLTRITWGGDARINLEIAVAKALRNVNIIARKRAARRS